MLSTDPKIIYTYLFWPIKNSIKKLIIAFFKDNVPLLLLSALNLIICGGLRYSQDAMMWSSDSKALPTGLWVSTTTITSPCNIKTNVKQPPSHLFFRQDSVN